MLLIQWKVTTLKDQISKSKVLLELSDLHFVYVYQHSHIDAMGMSIQAMFEARHLKKSDIKIEQLDVDSIYSSLHEANSVFKGQKTTSSFSRLLFLFHYRFASLCLFKNGMTQIRLWHEASDLESLDPEEVSSKLTNFLMIGCSTVQTCSCHILSICLLNAPSPFQRSRLRRLYLRMEVEALVAKRSCTQVNIVEEVLPITVDLHWASDIDH